MTYLSLLVQSSSNLQEHSLHPVGSVMQLALLSVAMPKSHLGRAVQRQVAHLVRDLRGLEHRATMVPHPHSQWVMGLQKLAAAALLKAHQGSEHSIVPLAPQEGLQPGVLQLVLQASLGPGVQPVVAAALALPVSAVAAVSEQAPAEMPLVPAHHPAAGL